MKPKQDPTNPTAGILDAVVDQTGVHWIRYGTDAHSTIFSLPELQIDEKEVFARLAGPGTTFLTSKAKNAFKAVIEFSQGVPARPRRCSPRLARWQLRFWRRQC